jgi:5-methylcytosine-specific restriction endonuclease McrA
MTDNYKEYLKSKEWFDIRESLFTLRGKKCEKCGSKQSIQVHHIHYKNIFKEQLEDLMVVCKDCHKKIHGLDKEENKTNERKKKSRTQKRKEKLTLKERKKANILRKIAGNRIYLSQTYH